MDDTSDRRRTAWPASATRLAAVLALLGTNMCACASRSWKCSEFTPPASARETRGELHIRYSGGVGTLDRADVPMFVRQEMERGVYLAGCVDDDDGMWDVDVVASAPEGADLPAALGTDETSPRIVVRLYRYEDDRSVQPVLFEEGQDVDVSGTLEALDTQSGSLAFDASLSKPCIGDCDSARSQLEIDAQLSW
jgi:hypothetical protein